jgi:SHS2 domain-containing protein
MPYRFVEDIAIADVAFEAWGASLEEMFVAAANATMRVMVEDLETIARREQRVLHLEADAGDMLLFQFLQELVFYKDAERLLLRADSMAIQRRGDDDWELTAAVFGEVIDPRRHELLVDVKAVTLHRFQVEAFEGGWKAFVILDI